MASNAKIAEHTFYDNVSTTDETDTCVLAINSNLSFLNVDFISTGTFAATVEGAIIDEKNFRPYPSFKLPTYELIKTEITDGRYFYSIDVTGIDYLKIKLTAITGTLTVRGRGVG